MSNAWHYRNTKMIPSLIIGVGGTGLSVVRQLKRRIRLEWPQNFRGDMPELIQFYALDTISYANRPDQEFLSPGEYGFLGGFDPQAMIGKNTSYPSIASWWTFNPDTIPAGVIHLGARQIRALGRLALFHSFPDIWRKISYKIDSLNNITAATQATRYGFEIPIETSARQIYIVSSICGGTGAGCFLDLAARIRAKYTTQVRIIGIFMLPSAFEHMLPSQRQVDRVRGNAYAALKEINAFWHAELQNPLRVRYPGEPTETKLDHALFEQIYLIGREGRGRYLSDINNITQQIAHFLYLQTISNLADPIGERLVNFDHLKKYYSSFAVGALSLPEQKMADHMLAALKIQCLLNLVRDPRNDQQREHLDSEIQAFIQVLKGHANAVLINFIDKTEADFNNYVRANRDDLIRQTLRWLLGKVVPAYGFNSIVDVAHYFAAEYERLIADLTPVEAELQTAKVKKDQRSSADRRGAIGLWDIRFRRLKPVEQYEEDIEALENEITLLKLLVPSDNNLSSPRMMTYANDILQDMAGRVNHFKFQAERLIGSISRDRDAAMARDSHVPSQNGEGREYRYYDMEIDPVLPGSKNAFDALRQSILTYSNLQDTITAERLLIPTLPNGSLDNVIPAQAIQLLGLYASADGRRATGHLQPISEVSTLINHIGHLNQIDRQDWEINSLTEEFVQLSVQETIKATGGLQSFFTQPNFQNAQGRVAMLNGIRSMLRAMMDHVMPFWGAKPFPEERHLERIQFLSMAQNPNDHPITKELFQEYSAPQGAYQYIPGIDPFRLDALYIEHGAEAKDIAELINCKRAYEAFKAAGSHKTLHLTPDYSDLPEPI